MPPRQKSVRTIVAEVVMYVGMVAIVGQIAANFWERFMIKSELTNMKSSLYTLKYAINNIGTAYDDLHKDLKNLVATTERKVPSLRSSSPPPVQYKNPRDTLYKYKIYKPEDEIEVKSVVRPKKGLDVATAFKRSVRDFMQECKLPVCRNGSTLTRYPLKSTAVGQDERHPGKHCCRIHRYYDRNNDGGRFKTLYDNL